MPRNHPTLESSSLMNKKVFLIFLQLSFVLHIPIFLLPSSFLFAPIDPKELPKRTIYIERLQRSARSKRLKKLPLRSKKRKIIHNKPKKRKPPEKVKGQVVDLPPTPDNKKPKHAKYLSEYNTSTKKETVSRHQRLKYRIAMRKLTRTRRIQPKKARLASRGITIRNGSKKKSHQLSKKRLPKKKARLLGMLSRRKVLRFRLPKIRKQRRLILRLSPDKARYRYNKHNRRRIRGKGKRLVIGLGIPTPTKKQQTQKDSQAKKKGLLAIPNVIDLRPNFGTLSRIQGAPAPDKIDAPKGDLTALNSKRWLYASFFNRVKRLIAQHWNPASVYRRRDPYRNIYGIKDRSTLLDVILHPSGHLSTVKVASSCGLKFLDNEAIRSVKAAQPFPNPPKALIKNGKIRFKFGFTLTLSRQRGFRIFR